MFSKNQNLCQILIRQTITCQQPCPLIYFAIVIPKFSRLKLLLKFKKNNSNLYKVCKEYVSFPDKINSTRQIFDKARHRIKLCSSGNLKEREGKRNRAQTVIFCGLKKTKASDTQAMSSLDRAMVSPLSF